MSDLVAISFPDEHTAFELRAVLAKLQAEYLIEMEDVAVVTKDAAGKVKLHQVTNLTAMGAVTGSFWGMLIGMLFFMPLVGAAVGAGAGALSGRFTDLGINDDFMKQLAEKFQPGGSAIFILVKKVNPDKVLAALEPFKGKGHVIQTSLAKDEEDGLKAFIEAHPQASTSA